MILKGLTLFCWGKSSMSKKTPAKFYPDCPNFLTWRNKILIYLLMTKEYYMPVLFCTFVLNPSKKIQSTLITSQKLAVLNEGFCNCDFLRLSDTYTVSSFIVAWCQRCFIFDSKVFIKTCFCKHFKDRLKIDKSILEDSFYLSWRSLIWKGMGVPLKNVILIIEVCVSFDKKVFKMLVFCYVNF